MHVRVTTINGAAHIDEGVAFVKDEVVPEVRQQRGYRGLTVSGDRSGGIVDTPRRLHRPRSGDDAAGVREHRQLCR